MPKKDDNIIYEEGCPDWMMTMGDCMSLLVTFFVLLLSFSTPDEAKLMDVIGGLQGALGIMPGIERPDISLYKEDKHGVGGEVQGGGKKEIMIKKENSAVVNLRTMKVINRYNEFRERLMELGFKNFVSAKQLEQGISVDIEFDKLFEPGSAQLDYRAPKLLESFANLANSVANELQVTAFFNLGQSNSWALATKRIDAISDMLRVKYNVAKYRFSYGYKVIDGKEKPHINLLLAEEIGINQVDITELINQSQDL